MVAVGAQQDEFHSASRLINRWRLLIRIGLGDFSIVHRTYSPVALPHKSRAKRAFGRQTIAATSKKASPWGERINVQPKARPDQRHFIMLLATGVSAIAILTAALDAWPLVARGQTA